MTPLHDFVAGDHVRTRSRRFNGTVRAASPNSGTVQVDWDDRKNNPRPAYTWYLDIERIDP